MKRIHIGVVVEDVTASLRFYETLFGAAPSFTGEGYARWMLDDPRVNFVISTRGDALGVGHLGIQVESGEELAEVTGRLKGAGHDLLEQAGSTCGFAIQNKAWTSDPQGVFWEAFHTLELNDRYGEDDFEDEQFTALFEQARGL
jgi:catechol 2,3-dioxygenase-like lactoylglutathione lyase family enzyme